MNPVASRTPASGVNCAERAGDCTKLTFSRDVAGTTCQPPLYPRPDRQTRRSYRCRVQHYLKAGSPCVAFFRTLFQITPTCNAAIRVLRYEIIQKSAERAASTAANTGLRMLLFTLWLCINSWHTAPGYARKQVTNDGNAGMRRIFGAE